MNSNKIALVSGLVFSGIAGVLATSISAQATPSSYIFLSENRQNTIKVADPSGNYIQDLIPQDSNGVTGIDGLAIGPGTSPDLYVGTVTARSIFTFNPTNGQFLGKLVSTGAGAVNGQGGLGSVTDIAFGPDGNLYVDNFDSFVGPHIPDGNPIVDPTKTDNILVFTPSGQYLQTLNFPGGGPQVPVGLTFFTNPSNGHSELLAATRGGTYDTNTGGTITAGGNAIYSFDLTSNQTTGTVFATGGLLSGPSGLVVGPDNLLYVSSLDSNKILRYNLDGTFNSVYVSDTTTLGINGPTALLLSPDKTEFLITGFNSANASIANFNTGALINNFIPAGGNSTFGFGKNEGALWVTSAQIGGAVVPEPLNILGAASTVIIGAFVKRKMKKK